MSFRILTLLQVLVAACAFAAPQDSQFSKAENILMNGCICGRTLYSAEFEKRRLEALNACVETLFGPEQKYKGAEPIDAECPQAAILALRNLKEYSDWKTSTFDQQQRESLDACFYGRLGWRNDDGSANAQAILEEIKTAQQKERQRGVDNLKRASREKDAEKKSVFMKQFNDSVFADKFLTHVSKRAIDSSVCDPSAVSQFYRCTFKDCFAAGTNHLAI